MTFYLFSRLYVCMYVWECLSSYSNVCLYYVGKLFHSFICLSVRVSVNLSIKNIYQENNFETDRNKFVIIKLHVLRYWIIVYLLSSDLSFRDVIAGLRITIVWELTCAVGERLTATVGKTNIWYFVKVSLWAIFNS